MNAYRRCRWLLLAGSFVALATPAQSVDPLARARAEYLLAYEVARAGVTLEGTDSEALRSYALYTYLEAARLGAALDDTAADWTAADSAVLDFLDEHRGEPVTANLRLSWLDSLAARELWPAFIEQYRDEIADTALRCRRLGAQIRIGDVADIVPLIRDEWLTPNQLPLECEPVFQWLRDQGQLDAELTAARVRLLLENGQAEFARIIARPLSADLAAPLLAWADLIERPLPALEAFIAMPAAAPEPAALLEGWSRLARDSPDAALGLYAALLGALDDSESSRFNLALALGLAWDRRAEALDYFDRVATTDMDDYALAWYARAALWAGSPELAGNAITQMSTEQADASSWRYWAARVSSDRDTRERLYESLAPRDNYYSAAAAAQTRDRASLHPEPVERDLLVQAYMSTFPPIARARELRRIGLPVAATREWQLAASRFSPYEQLQSIHLAAGLDWYDLAVATATELGQFFDYALLYPRPYRDIVDAAAKEFDLPSALIYAVMRQESLYRADAESAAGALGLMQLTRGTAEDVARLSGLPGSRGRDLLDPANNIRLGAARLAQLIERYDGHIVPALAAYNAGPAAADRWLPPEPLDGDIWLENVPYNETREYVRRVLWHTVVFEWLDDRRVQARDWLRPVRPQD
jgi:soluble lytic murein transglycosylase